MENRCREIERSIIKQYRKDIWRPFVKALNEYDMIQPGDNIAVCISGGKGVHAFGKMHAGDSSSWKNGVWTEISGDGSGVSSGKPPAD